MEEVRPLDYQAGRIRLGLSRKFSMAEVSFKAGIGSWVGWAAFCFIWYLRLHGGNSFLGGILGYLGVFLWSRMELLAVPISLAILVSIPILILTGIITGIAGIARRKSGSTYATIGLILSLLNAGVVGLLCVGIYQWGQGLAGLH